MINIAIIQGYVGKKETKTLNNGSDVTMLSIATSKRFKDAQGNPKEQTTWHNTSCFGKLCEIVEKYVQIGDLVHVRGEIQNKKIEHGDKAGQYIYSLHANEVQIVPKGNKADSQTKQKEQITSNPHFLDDTVPF
jgi:single-strand DNA-binding protein